MVTIKDRTSGVIIDSHDDGSVSLRHADQNVDLAFASHEEFAEFVRTAQEVLDES